MALKLVWEVKVLSETVPGIYLAGGKGDSPTAALHNLTAQVSHKLAETQGIKELVASALGAPGV